MSDYGYAAEATARARIATWLAAAARDLGMKTKCPRHALVSAFVTADYQERAAQAADFIGDNVTAAAAAERAADYLDDIEDHADVRAAETGTSPDATPMTPVEVTSEKQNVLNALAYGMGDDDSDADAIMRLAAIVHALSDLIDTAHEIPALRVSLRRAAIDARAAGTAAVERHAPSR